MDPTHIEQLAATAERCLAPLDQASTLPPSLFDDRDWFDEERRRVFHSGWVAVARSSEVATPNQFVTATIAGEPCVIIRTRDRELAALSNVCRHRSATIVGERSGSLSSLQCPYHLWTYGQDGQLRVAPGMDQADDFDLAGVCLPQFAVDEWHGFVLVNVDANARPMRECAPTLDTLFTEHRIGEAVSVGAREQSSPWNWKISVENFLESYHHRGIHSETLEPIYPGAKSFVPPTGDEPWTAVDHVSVVEGEEPFIALTMYPRSSSPSPVTPEWRGSGSTQSRSIARA
jgi:phenylpropionate dioxygenase-like ring-hydroxylating dioxygenase large terminal subunit